MSTIKPHNSKIYAALPCSIARTLLVFKAIQIKDGKVMSNCATCHSQALIKIMADARPTLIPLDRIQNKVYGS